ncbi:zeta toxin family protein [Nocardiopsis aegyptia]|uniref:zeta toxin family protein n=1 Tax=Nocardiopsis aegyptia TaxID=220378 RepID=UPI00366F61EC
MDPSQDFRRKLDDIYRRKIEGVHRKIPPAPDGKPVFVFVTGPMGAGKGTATDLYTSRVQKDFDKKTGGNPEGLGGYVHLDVDRMREHYPDYAALGLGTQGGLEVGEITRSTSSEWFDRSLADSLKKGKNIVAEGPRANSWVLEQVRNATNEQGDGWGYHVVVASIACSEEEANSGALVRYLDQVEDMGYGRNVPADIQHDAYQQVLPDLESAKEQRLCDEIHLHGRFEKESYHDTYLREQANGSRKWQELEDRNGTQEWVDSRPVAEPYTELIERPWSKDYADVMRSTNEDIRARVHGDAVLEAQHETFDAKIQARVDRAYGAHAENSDATATASSSDGVQTASVPKYGKIAGTGVGHRVPGHKQSTGADERANKGSVADVHNNRRGKSH